MRDQLSALTVDDVNRAIRKHLSGRDLHVVIITKDAAGLKQQLVSDAVRRSSTTHPSQATCSRRTGRSGR